MIQSGGINPKLFLKNRAPASGGQTSPISKSSPSQASPDRVTLSKGASEPAASKQSLPNLEASFGSKATSAKTDNTSQATPRPVRPRVGNHDKNRGMKELDQYGKKLSQWKQKFPGAEKQYQADQKAQAQRARSSQGLRGAIGPMR